MSNEYKIHSLIDILKLEYDQIDRLCAELPAFLKQVKATTDLISIAAEDDGALDVLSPMTWYDDGKKDITLSVTCEGEEVFSYKSTQGEGPS